MKMELDNINKVNLSKETVHLSLQLQRLDELISISSEMAAKPGPYLEQIVWTARKRALELHYEKYFDRLVKSCDTDMELTVKKQLANILN